MVDVGVDLVTTEGTASIGLREIARRAGVSHGAPRRYFPTHHALLSAIAHRGFADLRERFTVALAGATSARDQVRALARAYVGYALENRGMFELMFRHDLLDSERHPSDRPRLRESTLPMFEVTVGLVVRCREERDATTGAGPRSRDADADDDPPAAVSAAALWANLHGVAQLWNWGSLQLALDVGPDDGTAGREPLEELDQIIAAVLDAHLGRATR
nr:TetR/AcrR family transcriptional regulator [Actinopolymorpha pittospori]